MRVELKSYSCIVFRDNDSKIYSESLFFHKLKTELIKQGYDVIKKQMWKDGHLVDDNQYYVRSRETKENKTDMRRSFAVYDTQYAFQFAYEPYNKDGQVTLAVIRDIFKEK